MRMRYDIYFELGLLTIKMTLLTQRYLFADPLLGCKKELHMKR